MDDHQRFVLRLAADLDQIRHGMESDDPKIQEQAEIQFRSMLVGLSQVDLDKLFAIAGIWLAALDCYNLTDDSLIEGDEKA